jgi:hypothetical protein
LKLENSRQSLPPRSAASSADRRLSCSLPSKRVFRAPATWQPRVETQAKGRFTSSRSPMRLSHERDERRIAWVTDHDCKTGSGDLRPRYAIIGSILTLALFGEPLKSGALLGRRIKYQSFDVLSRAAGFAAARHGRAAPVSGSDAVGGANLILVEGIAPGVLALRLRVAPDLPARGGGARRPSA